MSDALLTEISKKLDVIAGLLKAPGGAVAPKAATAATAAASRPPAADPNALAADSTKSAAEKKAAADKAIAARKAAKEAAAPAAAATKPAAASTKAPGGKHTIDQVREMIRKVAADIDKQSAKDILSDDGGGVEKVIDLKPEFYDRVFEACEVLLAGEGKAAPAAAVEEDDFA
jgi:hypothetical protein